MADEKKEVISRHLREVKAKRKTTSFKSLVKRLKLEQEFRKILVALKENEVAWQEVLPSLIPEKEIGFTPDFIVWKYDVKLPISLIECEEDKCTISRSELADYLSLLKRTDYDAVLAVWMSSPRFPCRVFKLTDIESFIKSKDEHFVIDDVSPFKQRLLDFFNEKILVLPVMKLKGIPELRKPEKLLKSFQSTLRETIKIEVKSRKPHLTHRKEAITDISNKDLDKICSLISKYFMGELGTKDVVRLLKDLIGTRHDT
jgi:hypothetical protein